MARLKTPSAQQTTIFKWVTESTGSLVVIAVAGSGKTTTLVEMAHLIPSYMQCAFVAFNKSVADELKLRLPGHFKAQTLNSMGHSAWCSYIGKGSKFELQSYKTKTVMRNNMPQNKYFEHVGSVPKLVALAKSIGLVPFNVSDMAQGLTPDTDEAWQGLIDHHQIEIKPGMENEAVYWAREILSISIKMGKELIDYDDQLYLPIIHNAKFWPNDWLFVDEAQDVNLIQREMLRRALRAGGRFVAVGDPCQPFGTLVEVANKSGRFQVKSRELLPIQDLKIGTWVTSYSFKDRGPVARQIKGITKRPYSGQLVVAAAKGQVSRYTLNHRCVVKHPGDGYAVYLMQRGDAFRIGTSKLSHEQGCGPVLRMRYEQASAVWILSVHPTRLAARVAEAHISAMSGIPMLCFQWTNGNAFSQEQLDRIWLNVNNWQQADRLLSACGRLITHPYFVKEQKQASVCRPHEVYACNVLPGSQVKLRGGEWETASWSREFVSNLWVYSLSVDGEELYFGDNILTHNCQAIYGFRGADVDSIENIKKEFKAIELPLTVSYRCPQMVVAEAQKYVKHITAAETNPTGVVRHQTDKYNHELFQPTDVILCRNSAPLVNMVFRLLRNGVGAKILGRDIGQGVISLIEQMRARTIEQLEDKLGEYRNREVQKLVKANKDEQADSLNDKVDTILAFVANLPEDKRSIQDLIAQIEDIFADKQGKGLLTLCTIHKAKGLEFPRVFILDADTLMPSKWARKPWQQVQETNLHYVAVTRAQQELVYLSSAGFEDKTKAPVQAPPFVSTGISLEFTPMKLPVGPLMCGRDYGGVEAVATVICSAEPALVPTLAEFQTLLSNKSGQDKFDYSYALATRLKLKTDYSPDERINHMQRCMAIKKYLKGVSK